MNIELLIQDGDKLFMPVVESGINWSTERQGSPSKLTFTIIDDGNITIAEGDPVRLKVDDQKVFYGFVFTLKRSQDKKIQVTAYDQLRYLKNKDTYVYENKTASQVIGMVGKDFNLNMGSVESTKFIIPSRVEDNATLFDIIQNALDLELQNKGELYVLFDDFGKLTLKNIGSMKVDIIINADTAQSYSYQSTIDSNTYNQIKLFYDNNDTGKREVYIAKDSTNINKWGVLQYYESLQEGENGKAKADALLKLYNQKSRSLTVSGAFGDVRCRAGSMVVVQFDLGDVKLQNYMLIEKASHKFEKDQYMMDLTLRGGDING